MKVENDAFESLDLIKFEDFEMFVFCIIEFENDVIVEFVSIERWNFKIVELYVMNIENDVLSSLVVNMNNWSFELALK